MQQSESPALAAGRNHPGSDDDSPACADAAPTTEDLGSGLLWHLRWTIPLHALLPVGLWWLMRIDPALAGQVFLWMHFVCLTAFLVTLRWWWAHSADLVAVLFINHIVSLAVCVLLPW